jgi:hypothetical protein
VTHTGHPGPDSNDTVCGSKDRMPLRKIDTVCVPHTSISRTFFLLMDLIFWINF